MTYLQARSEKEKSRRKRVIVSAAKQLFYNKGYSVTVDEIAEKAKLSKATLYLYYKNKDELYVAAMMEGFQGLEERFIQAKDSGRSLEQKLWDTYHSFVDYMLQNRKFFRITQHYLAEDFLSRISPGPAQIVQGEILRHLEYVRQLIKEGVDCGFFRQDLDVNAFTTIIWRTATGLLDLAAVDEGSKSSSGRWGQIFATSFSVLVNGTRSAKGRKGPARSPEPEASKDG